MKFELISENNYADARSFIGSSRWGNLLMPRSFNPSCWGVLAMDGTGHICGVWSGVLRGNGKLVRLLARSVYFDALPIGDSEEVTNGIVEFAKAEARRQKIIVFNLTHWTRGEACVPECTQKNGTFLIDLSKSEDELWKDVESKQRNIVRKGEKSGVVFDTFTGSGSLKYLDRFQQLRMDTQSRAVKHNANASMLLKSNDFFSKIFTDTDSTLCIGRVGNDIATVALMLQGGETVYYYSGGSDYNLNRTTGSSAYVIWKSILYFKEKGARYFDLGGVPVFPDHTNPDKSHPAYGVFQFKRSFGGEYLESNGGKIVIDKFRNSLVEILMKNRKLLRFLSKKGM